ncbi:class I adenylate-forming enzyme family protein [Parablastomonas sp. CN1-191]|uniref:class I adenylate-forming enzyme family protein n=1 Tax=Parablastomonas sp. CN1-191 TaxID=3400908 RepID=UPI003BF7F509
MTSELDKSLQDVLDRLSAAGGPLETEPMTMYGRELPILKAAPATLAVMFEATCAQHGDATFLVDGDVRLSFAQTYAAARAVAGGLVAGFALQKGERVGIAARNSANWIVAYMGVLMAGGCATLLNGWWTGAELAEGIALAECRLVLADAARAARLEGTAHGAEVVEFAHGGDPLTGLGPLMARGGGTDTALPALTGDDLSTILYTSGSTGQAKGAWSDHLGVTQAVYNYVAQTLLVLHHLTDRGEPPVGQPATLVNVPLFHVTGEVPVMLQSFVIGRKLVLMPKWDAQEAMRLIEREQVSYFVGVPLMSYEIATHPNRARYDLSTCKSFAAGGAPRPVDHVRRIREALPGAYPLLGYGLTETNAVGAGNVNENYLDKPGSTGPASRPLVELGILDDAGRQLPQGETGEIAIRSICNFRGYWNNAEATAAALTADGWFRSGDLGYLDGDGYLFIVDRKKDIIIRGGENISCIEVEQALYAHPGVAEASVFGLPSARLGEEVGAVFLAEEGADLTPEALCEWASQRLAPFKVPVKIWQAHEALPRLGTEKVDKRALRTLYVPRWEADEPA